MHIGIIIILICIIAFFVIVVFASVYISGKHKDRNAEDRAQIEYMKQYCQEQAIKAEKKKTKKIF